MYAFIHACIMLHACANQIWSALRRVQMGRVVRSKMPLGLHSDIRESGANLSVGEKQLLCLVTAYGVWVRTVRTDPTRAGPGKSAGRAVWLGCASLCVGRVVGR
jgi:hypothetical protein